jgi:hypothetical protein
MKSFFAALRRRRSAGQPRRRLTYANITSTLALFLVVAGGTAYAANHYIITKKSQIKPSVLAQLKGNTGAPGISDYNVVNSGEIDSPPTAQSAEGTATCPSGQSVLGGGIVDYGDQTGQNVNTSQPLEGDNGWQGYVNNSTADDTAFAVYAICATVTTGG